MKFSASALCPCLFHKTLDIHIRRKLCMYGAGKHYIDLVIVELLKLCMGGDEIRSPVCHFFDRFKDNLVACGGCLKENVNKASGVLILL